jgi:threonylcarbamoyladenosine tRNA methylthiotransferase MtaB
LVGLGYKEIVLSGINLGRWGRDLAAAEAALSAATSLARLKACPDTKRTRFVDLLRAMLAETDIQKIRISSVEPMDWSNELIEVVANSPRVCKHAHVPLQSGSDRILRRMHRKYRPWHYADRIQKIRAAMPTAAIGADVMVGFPGETDEQFEETRAFIESLPFTYLHVFTYSSRPGTPSASMPEQVRGDVTRERNRVLRELAARKKREFQEQFVGRDLEAITLTNVEDGRTEGLTDNYQKVWIEGRQASNQLVTIIVQGIEGEALTGAIRS